MTHLSPRTIRLAISLMLPCFLISLNAKAESDDWEFEVSPYIWAMGIDGDLKVKRAEYHASADFSDILEQTKYGAQILLEANRGRWVSMLQTDYGVLESDNISGPLGLADVEIEITSLLATLATGYRIPLGERNTVDVMLGVRYAGFQTDIDNSLLGSSTTQESVYDGIVMVRPRIYLGDNWQLRSAISMGAGDSEKTWEVFPEVIYHPGEWTYRLGYRILGYEFEQGDMDLDIEMPGLVVGVGRAF